MKHLKRNLILITGFTMILAVLSVIATIVVTVLATKKGLILSAMFITFLALTAFFTTVTVDVQVICWLRRAQKEADQDNKTNDK
ncbi:MAG TPA: hypothetical protein H9762_06190 [Candidatus Ligilactobacillus avistercoris]|nr:hypothetical protein [Candidatus Ligilactobacillus avistercoris]